MSIPAAVYGLIFHPNILFLVLRYRAAIFNEPPTKCLPSFLGGDNLPQSLCFNNNLERLAAVLQQHPPALQSQSVMREWIFFFTRSISVKKTTSERCCTTSGAYQQGDSLRDKCYKRFHGFLGYLICRRALHGPQAWKNS